MDEPEFGVMRFEDAVEPAAALFACAANGAANGAAEETGLFSRVSVEATKTLVVRSTVGTNVRGMDATRWRRVLACLAPAAIDVCERHGAEYLKNNTLVSAREDFRDEVFSRVWRMMKADGAEMDGSKDDPERASDDFEAFEAYFFDMLRLDATRELLLGPPGAVRDAFGTHHGSGPGSRGRSGLG